MLSICRTQFLLKSLLLTSIFFTSTAHFQPKPSATANQTPTAPAQNISVISNSKGLIKIGGNFKLDSSCSFNPLFLNKNITADRYNSVKNSVDVDFDYFSNPELEYKSAVQVHGTVRHKSYWGNANESFKNNSSDVFSSTGAKLSSHSHDVSKPGIWIKELWLKCHLDKCAGIDLAEENCTSLNLGYFPFQLGRGISLGSGYGTPKDFLGIYNRVNDYCAPGVLLTQIGSKGRFELNLYYALLESKSASPRQTLASKKEKQPGFKLTPWAGSGNDDQLLSTQIAYNFSSLKDKTGTEMNGKLFGYGLFNYAPAKKIELEYDSDSMLFTVGCGFDGNVGICEVGFEMAKNFGYEKMYTIDRNSLKSVRDASGSIVEQYSHIQQESVLGAGDWSNANVTTALKQALDTNLYQQNGTQFMAGGNSYRSSSRRIRPSFNNDYRGWMMLADIAWNFEGKHGVFKPALAGGIATGDTNPEVSETDKVYNGFVGLNECYSGNKVISVIVLDDRSMNRPMTITATDRADKPAKTDSSFTDLKFFGAGMLVTPSRFAKYKFSMNLNMIGFWKDHASKAITFDNGNNPVISTNDARRFLGTEFNNILKFEPFKNMTFAIKLAAFVPGGYYHDIAGARVVDDAMKAFEESDLQQLDTKAYGMGKDTTFFIGSTLTYKF